MIGSFKRDSYRDWNRIREKSFLPLSGRRYYIYILPSPGGVIVKKRVKEASVVLIAVFMWSLPAAASSDEQMSQREALEVLKGIFDHDKSSNSSDYDFIRKYGMHLSRKSFGLCSTDPVPLLRPHFLKALDLASRDSTNDKLFSRMDLVIPKEKAAQLLSTRSFLHNNPSVLKVMMGWFEETREPWGFELKRDVSVDFFTCVFGDLALRRQCLLFWAQQEHFKTSAVMEQFIKKVASLCYPEILNTARHTPKPLSREAFFSSKVKNNDVKATLMEEFLEECFRANSSTDTVYINGTRLWKALASSESKLFDSRLKYYGLFVGEKNTGAWRPVEIDPTLMLYTMETEGGVMLIIDLRVKPKGEKSLPILFVGQPEEEVKAGKIPEGYLIPEEHTSTVENYPGSMYLFPDVQSNMKAIILTDAKSEIPDGIQSYGSTGELLAYTAEGDVIGIFSQTMETPVLDNGWGLYSGNVLVGPPVFCDVNGDKLYDIIWKTELREWNETHHYLFLQNGENGFDLKAF